MLRLLSRRQRSWIGLTLYRNPLALEPRGLFSSPCPWQTECARVALPDPMRLRLARDPVASSIAGEIVSSYSPGGSMSRMKAQLLMLKAYSGFRHRAKYLARTLA